MCKSGLRSLSFLYFYEARRSRDGVRAKLARAARRRRILGVVSWLPLAVTAACPPQSAENPNEKANAPFLRVFRLLATLEFSCDSSGACLRPVCVPRRFGVFWGSIKATLPKSR